MDVWLARLKGGILPFICFLGGAILGTAFVLAFRAATGKKKPGGDPPSVRAADVSGETDRAVAFFFSNRTGIDFRSKTRTFFSSIDYLCSQISSFYYLDGVKKYRLFRGTEWTGDGLETVLEFNVFEAIAFFDSVLITVQTALEEAISSDKFRISYSVYRFFRPKYPENPADAKLAGVIAVFHPPAAENQSAVKKFFSSAAKKIAAPVLKYGIRKAAPSVEEVSDAFYAACIRGIAEDINFLYSRNFYKGVGTLSLLPTDDKEEDE